MKTVNQIIYAMVGLVLMGCLLNLHQIIKVERLHTMTIQNDLTERLIDKDKKMPLRFSMRYFTLTK
jgi:hypothetical protein